MNLIVEKHFEFRDKLVTSNFPFAYILRKKNENEVSLQDGVAFSGDCSTVIGHAEDDFRDYLKVCFGIEEQGANPLQIKVVLTQKDLEDVSAYKGRIVEISDHGILIRAYDERGAAQAIYDLKDAMSMAKQPFLSKGVSKNKPLLSPSYRFVFGIFPDLPRLSFVSSPFGGTAVP